MKRILALVLVCGFVLGLGGCSGLFESEHEVKIAIGMGASNHPVHRIVQHGFNKGIEHHCATKVDATMDEGSTQELMAKYEWAVVEEKADGMLLWSAAATKVVGIINANPDIVGAFGTTAGSAQSWTKAMEMTGRTDLVIIGVDVTAENLDVLENGPITGLMCMPLYDEGYNSVGILHDVINGTPYNKTEEDWNIVYDVVGLTKDSDLTPYHNLIEKMKNAS